MNSKLTKSSMLKNYLFLPSLFCHRIYSKVESKEPNTTTKRNNQKMKRIFPVPIFQNADCNKPGIYELGEGGRGGVVTDCVPQ